MPAGNVPEVPADIELLTGPLLLGYLFNWGLFGILCIQVYMYHLSFPRDGKVIKALVYGLFITDIVQTALTTHNAWHFLAKGWGDPAVLRNPGWSWIAVPLLSGIVSATVQLFFAWRIWKLSESFLLAVPIAVVALTQGICGMISGIWFSFINDVTKISQLFPVATVWLGGSAFTDILITMSLVVYLRQATTGFDATDHVLTRLIRMTIETGAVTSFAAGMELILYLVYKENNLHMIPALALAKLYTNTLLATLNSRSPVFTASTNANLTTSNAWNGMMTSQVPRSTHLSVYRPGISKVQIMTTQETHHDVEESDIAMAELKVESITLAGSENGMDANSAKTCYNGDDSYRHDLEAGRD